ncbi:MAG: putative baseplate assembly protein [Desulfosarcinaceae bacterium]|nr:putative baseplate assembly protein [Desulfosarcinaceae bacterium]
MSERYHCQRPQRREKVRTTLSEGEPVLNGIDYLEIDPQDPLLLAVHFLHPLPPSPQLTPAHFSIEGGVRITDITIAHVQIDAQHLMLRVSKSGDFSNYRLRLHAAGDSKRLPAGFSPPFDSRLSSLTFSFKAACPSDLDCRPASACPPTATPLPAIDYLAKDYDSFRSLMLDRMRLHMPDWKEESPADLLIALTELFAHVGDQLSYFQDAAAGEAYLHTARLRASVRRHARLLDYQMHDGCNARTWVCFQVDGPVTLAPGTQLMAVDQTQRGGDTAVLPPATFDPLADGGKGVVFETCQSDDIDLRVAHNALTFHTWSDADCCLSVGSTSATLVRAPGQVLTIGQILLFEEVRDPGKEGGPADPTHRHAVRLVAVNTAHDALEDQDLWEIAWHPEDALPFVLCLHQTETAEGATAPVSVARANVVLADHGRRLQPPVAAVIPDTADDGYRPQVHHRGLTFAAPLDWGTAEKPTAASRLLRQAPSEARPDGFTLTSGDTTWRVVDSLLHAGPLDPSFVVETDDDGGARLRFGDPAHGVMGRVPTDGVKMLAQYRIGNGQAGNLGAEALNRVRSGTSGITQVRNPLPAIGGTEPETTSAVKAYAPHQFRRQERAVTEADYAAMAQRFPGVQRAAAYFRWTGSWTTVFVTVDRLGGQAVTQVFADDLRAFLEPFRMAGYDLEVIPPAYAPLEIAVSVCLAEGYTAAQVKAELLAVLGAGMGADGTTGRFHPDRYTFGQAVYLSEIVAAAIAIDGVAAADVTRLHRLGGLPDGELEKGYFSPGDLEIVQMDNDPNFPERGQLTLEFTGGL